MPMEEAAVDLVSLKVLVALLQDLVVVLDMQIMGVIQEGLQLLYLLVLKDMLVVMHTILTKEVVEVVVLAV